jgi:hypothetical protein
MFAQKRCFEIEAHLMPETAGIPWRGYHGFRRGNATYLAKHQGSHAAALMLRHSNVSTTETNYIKNSAQDRRAQKQRNKWRSQQNGNMLPQLLGLAQQENKPTDLFNVQRVFSRRNCRAKVCKVQIMPFFFVCKYLAERGGFEPPIELLTL